MRLAHLILTHKNPAQLERLLDALDHPAFDFYIHLDGKTDMAPFAHIAQRPRTYFIHRRAKIYWAGFGTIQATLNGFREILGGVHAAGAAHASGGANASGAAHAGNGAPAGAAYDYINVISGQDFPLRSAEDIYAHIAARAGSEFITCESTRTTWPQAADRVTRYHLINWRIPGKFTLEKLINKLLPARKFPMPEHEIVGRANWFTLTPAAIRYTLDFLDRHPELIRFYKYSWGADELIWSTILYNSDFRPKIVDNLVYVDWTGQHEGHPRVLRAQDLPALQATDKLFGRKFDMAVDEEVFGLIERWVAAGRSQP
jgi:hypothetical protein